MGKFMDDFCKESIIMDKTLFARRWSLSTTSYKNEYFALQEKLRSIDILAKLTKFLDFNCNFVDGLCKSRQGQPISSKRESYMCCCSLCYDTKAYLKGHILESRIETYDELFKENNGFWIPGEGCSLPVELRSPLCLYYNCHEDLEFRRVTEEFQHNMTNLLNEAVALSNKLMVELKEKKSKG